MTLRELQERINAVIAENDRIATLGWREDGNRNDLPLAVRLDSYPLKANGKRGYKSRYIALDRLDASRHGLNTLDVVCFTAKEDEGHLWPPARTRKAKATAVTHPEVK